MVSALAQGMFFSLLLLQIHSWRRPSTSAAPAAQRNPVQFLGCGGRQPPLRPDKEVHLVGNCIQCSVIVYKKTLFNSSSSQFGVHRGYLPRQRPDAVEVVQVKWNTNSIYHPIQTIPIWLVDFNPKSRNLSIFFLKYFNHMIEGNEFITTHFIATTQTNTTSTWTADSHASSVPLSHS